MKKHRRNKRGKYRIMRQNERVLKEMCEPSHKFRKRQFSKAVLRRIGDEAHKEFSETLAKGIHNDN